MNIKLSTMLRLTRLGDTCALIAAIGSSAFVAAPFVAVVPFAAVAVSQVLCCSTMSLIDRYGYVAVILCVPLFLSMLYSLRAFLIAKAGASIQCC